MHTHFIYICRHDDVLWDSMISGVDNIINQSHLAGVVKALFPGHGTLHLPSPLPSPILFPLLPPVISFNIDYFPLDLKTNSRKSAKISNPITGKYLELDIWIPTLQMSFEFQVLLSLPPSLPPSSFPFPSAPSPLLLSILFQINWWQC